MGIENNNIIWYYYCNFDKIDKKPRKTHIIVAVIESIVTEWRVKTGHAVDPAVRR